MSEIDPILRACFLASEVTLRTLHAQLRDLWYREAYALEPPVEELLAGWLVAAEQFREEAKGLEEAWTP
jgi:hypothetical protein